MHAELLPALSLLLIVVGIVVYHLPCHHGRGCRECAEEKRVEALRKEEEERKQKKLRVEYARRTHLGSMCSDCGDWHVPHEDAHDG